MSSDDDIEDEEPGEEPRKSAKGEDHLSYLDLQIDEPIIPKSLTYEDASLGLHMLGKDESGMRYAYLMITAANRKYTEISVLLKFVHVLFLDLSGNKLALDALQCLVDMPYLIYLQADRNILEACDLCPFALLQVLNLSNNKIMNTSGIVQPILECLNLNYNFIDNVELRTENTPNLKLLEIRGNLLDHLKGIYPTTIEHLYLAENKIQFLYEDTLNTLVNLQSLHVRDNLIHKLNGFTTNLPKLKYLNIRKNLITKLRELHKLAQLKNLEVLVIAQNPICAEPEVVGEGAEDDKEDADDEEMGEGDDELDKFRLSVLTLLPNLKRINKNLVTAQERVAVELKRDARFKEIMGEASTVDAYSRKFGEYSDEEDTVYDEENFVEV